MRSSHVALSIRFPEYPVPLHVAEHSVAEIRHFGVDVTLHDVPTASAQPALDRIGEIIAKWAAEDPTGVRLNHSGYMVRQTMYIRCQAMIPLDGNFPRPEIRTRLLGLCNSLNEVFPRCGLTIFHTTGEAWKLEPHLA